MSARSIFQPHNQNARPLGALPNGFWPVVHTFGQDNHRVLSNPRRESFTKYWWNDDPKDPNWNVFIEGVVKPTSQAPRNWRIMGGLLDSWPRTVYYGGPTSRVMAPQFRKSFEDWAKSLGYAYETAIVPVQPNASGMRHPSTNFVWYIANETRPPKSYRYVRDYNGNGSFRWVDQSFDTWKYANFHQQNPNVV